MRCARRIVALCAGLLVALHSFDARGNERGAFYAYGNVAPGMHIAVLK